MLRFGYSPKRAILATLISIIVIVVMGLWSRDKFVVLLLGAIFVCSGVYWRKNDA